MIAMGKWREIVRLMSAMEKMERNYNILSKDDFIYEEMLRN